MLGRHRLIAHHLWQIQIVVVVHVLNGLKSVGSDYVRARARPVGPSERPMTEEPGYCCSARTNWSRSASLTSETAQ